MLGVLASHHSHRVSRRLRAFAAKTFQAVENDRERMPLKIVFSRRYPDTPGLSIRRSGFSAPVRIATLRIAFGFFSFSPQLRVMLATCAALCTYGSFPQRGLFWVQP